MAKGKTPISEEWLVEVGFKWHQLDRQPFKHWLLWLGAAVRGNDQSLTDDEDIGIELSRGGHPGQPQDRWFCWLRSDAAHRYHRFIHVRHLRTTEEVEELVSAMTGQTWDPTNHLYGSVRTPDKVARIQQADKRLDRRLQAEGHPWHLPEADSTIGRPLIEHLEAHEQVKRST